MLVDVIWRSTSGFVVLFTGRELGREVMCSTTAGKAWRGVMDIRLLETLNDTHAHFVR